MKFTVIIILTACMQASAGGYSQTVSLSEKNISLEKVFKEIKKQTNYDFWYEGKLIKQAKRIDIHAINAPLEQVLNICFQNQPLTYTIIEKTVVVKPKPAVIPGTENTVPAPPIEIRGIITGENGKPLDGASVKLKGTDKGTVTDAQGNFSLQIPDDGGMLVISYIGYETIETRVSKSVSLQINLKLSESKTEEIVVVGYGTQKRRDIIGSVAEVKPDNIGGLKAAPTFDAALQGQVPGVSIQSSTGVPGSATKILIRGANSINSSTDPLWIIDGMPLTTGNLGYNNGSTEQNPLSLINPNDIESIQVLKDAASTAIYGSRGSNGVIIVTTRSAKGKRPMNSVSVATGTSKMIKDFSDMGFADTKTWFAILDKAYNNSDRGNFPIDDYFRTVPLARTKITREQALQNNTNWFNEVFGSGSYIDANASSGKSFDGGNYYFSANYRDDKGVMMNNRMKRYTVRSNVEFNPFKNFTFGTRLNFSLTKNNRTQNDDAGSDNGNINGNSGGINNLTKLSLPWLPVYDPTNPSAYYNPYAGFNLKAYADSRNVLNELTSMRMIGGAYAEYNFAAVKGLSLRSEFSFDLMQATTTLWVSKDVRLNGSGQASTMGLEQAANTYNINYNGYATYNRTFNDVHAINVVAGAEATRGHGYVREEQGEGLTGSYQQLGRPVTMLGMRGGYAGEEYLMGLFGRANYTYNKKYMIGASFRRDGSSNFTPENRWGNFSSIAVGWIISEENFMKSISDHTFLKLRASYGETGNKNVPSSLNVINYNNTYRYGSANYLGVNGTLPGNIPSLDITWETTNTTDIGLDYGFLSGRITGTIEYYNRYVKKMLLQGPVPSSAGVDNGVYDYNASKIWGNVGDMVNRGVEFQIHTVNINRNGFRWTTDFNIASNKNIIKHLTADVDKSGKGMISGTFISRTGNMRREWYMADFAYVDPETGIEKIYVVDPDVYAKTGETVRAKNGAGQDSTTFATNTNIANNFFDLKGKSADPKYYGGFNNTFEYKGFDFSFLFTFSGGNYIYDFNEQVNSYPTSKYNLKAAILDQSWQKPGDVAKYQKLTYRNSQVIDGAVVDDFSREFTYITFDKYMYKGDFIRLKNLQLGYNLQPNALKKIGFQAFRIYVSATNLWTKTKFPGWDPEGAIMTAVDQIPQLKTWSVGLNARF
ncbi:MAG: SusC/RagA family TonB-linked outer membrane protein [Chitinophagaceae bacterium]|nr:SusC/RagA family TonB-linked outer membrane protein [Chitinophagaceae bacterium]